MDQQEKNQNINIVNVKIDYPVKVNYFVAFLLLVINGLYFIYSETITDKLIFLAATTAAAGGILSAFYTSRALNTQNKSLEIAQSETAARVGIEQEQFIFKRDFERKKMAVSLASTWNEPSMQKARRTCRELVNLKNHSLTDLKKALTEKNKIDDVIHLLNFLEEVSVAEAEGIGDPEILKKFFGDIVIQIWGTLESWVKEYRVLRDTPGMWDVVEELKKKWEVKSPPM